MAWDKEPSGRDSSGPSRKDKDQGQDPFGIRSEGHRPQWTAFLWLALGVLLLFFLLDAVQQTDEIELPYSTFREAVSENYVSAVTLRGQDIEGTLNEDGREALEVPEPGEFVSVRPEVEDARLLGFLEEHGVTISARPVDPPWWQQLLVTALPWILILGLLFWFWHRMAGRMMSGGGAMNFGQSKAKKFRREDSHVRMTDVAGSDNAKREISEVVAFLKNPDEFRELGAKIPRGVLMLGPPGTGKTLLARAVAGEAEVPFYSISGSEFIEMFVGVGASRVRDMFEQAKKEAPSVIFIDEIDSVGRSRGTGLGGGHDEREQTLNQILAEMDGFEEHESVVVLAATNRPDVLDQALLRPGRFDRKITMELPHREARTAIMKVHTAKMPLADDVDLDRLAKLTMGFSGADLANLANEAALLAGRRGQQQIDWNCFTSARDRVLLGDTRETNLPDRERHLVAYHESGHALLAWLLPHADPLEKVTIVPRGQALGVTAQVPREEQYNYGESYLRDRIAVMFGGRLAERIVFGECSSGAENDLSQAASVARRMIANWGMSRRLGPAAFPQDGEQPFLGKEISQGRQHSESTAALIDEEIRELLSEIEARAQDLLERNRERLDALAHALEDRETLEIEEIRSILGEQPARQTA